MKSGPRRIYLGPEQLLAELTMVGYDHFQRAGRLPAHVHADAFEICLIISGSVDWWAGDQLHEVRGGELYVTRPGEVHGGVNSVMNPCQLYWFHVVFGPRQPLRGISARESNFLFRRLSGLTLRSFRASEATRQACSRLLDDHARRDELAAVSARAWLHALIVGTLRDHDAALRRRSTLSPAVRAAMAFMTEHLAQPLGIESAAEAAGISVGRLHARFLAETGLTPGEWRLRHLLGQAKARLRNSDQAITDIALDLGFSSSQYFATAFKRVTGFTPREYRRAGTHATGVA